MDIFSLQVLGRLQMRSDLVAAEAVYHKCCRSLFSNIKSHCESTTSASNTPGRPQNSQMSAKFEELCDYLEFKADEVLTQTELHEKLCRS